MKNGTWKLVDPLVGTKPIGYKWVYENKHISYSLLDKHKVRLVAKGYVQKEGIDYEYMLSSTTKWYIPNFSKERKASLLALLKNELACSKRKMSY